MNKKRVVSWFAIAGACAVVCGGLCAMPVTAESTSTLISELFLPSSMLVEPMQMDSDMLYFEKGIRLQTEDVKAKSTWKQTVSGEFSFEYISTGESASTSTLEIAFENADNADSFTLVIEHGATKNAYVRFNDVEAGTFYYRQGEVSGLTELCNAEGKYTQFTADKIRVCFDPNEMTVRVGSAEGVQLLVWDMLTSENDGRDVGETLVPFSRYDVSFSMPQFAGETGEIILYEVNGYTLDGLLLENSGAPSIFADFKKDALVGESYTLPKGYAYDVKDGELSTQVSVYDELGEEIAKNTSSFIPKKQGMYTVKYVTENKFGKISEKSYSLIAYENKPNGKYELDWNLEEEQALGQKAFIPELILYEGLCRYGFEVGTVSVKKDGISLLAYKNIRSGFYFTFSSVGTYVFIYDLGETKLSYEIRVNETENKFIVNGLQGTYTKDSIVDCTDGYVVIDGNRTAFDFTVEFPNGKRYTNKKFQTNLLGKYVLRASATVLGDEFAFEKTFTVAVRTADTFTSLSSDVTISEGKSVFTGREGAVITSKRADTVEYTQTVDIGKYVEQTTTNKDGRIVLSDTATPLIELSVDPDGYQKAAATGLNVYITDAEDPNNKITVNIANCGSLAWSYIRAAATGQPLTGFENKASGSDVLNNAVGILRTSNFGFMIQHSFCGALTGEQTASQSKIALYYDSETKQLLSVAGGSSEKPTNVIMDFDDPAFCGTVWDGFSSDKVNISFSVASFSAGEAKVIVYSIDGVNFSTMSSIESEQPKIQVETDSLVGLKGTSLAVPKIRVTDSFGQDVLDVVCKVFYEKDGEYFDVSVKDGRFSTMRSGRYVIDYIATDAFGNVAKKRVDVNVLEEADDLTIAMEVPQEYQSGSIGNRVNVYLPTETDVLGGIGAITTTWKILLQGNCIAENTQRLKLEAVGDYTVEYTFTDAVGRSLTASYVISVETPTEPIIVSEIPHFVGFVRGNTYDIPEVYFIDYTQGNAEKQKASVYIDGVLFTGNCYTPEQKIQGKQEQEDDTKITLEYRYGTKTLQSYEIPVKTVYRTAEQKVGSLTIDITQYLYERYFVTDEMSEVKSKSDHLALYSQADGSVMAFAQPLSSKTLRFTLDVDFERHADLSPVTSNLQAIQIFIVDATDSSKKVELLLHSDESTGLLKMTVNGKESATTFKGSLLGVCSELIDIGYDAQKKVFYDGNTSAPIISLTEYANGEQFDGFNELVYISFCPIAYDAQEEASIRLYSLNGQTFNNSSLDDVGAPTLSVKESVSGVYETGTMITVSEASATDVLSNVSQIYVTVTCTYGDKTTIVKDVDGVPLEMVATDRTYTFCLTEIGDYRITYVAKDGRQGECSETYVLTATKQSEPVISLSDSLPTNVKVGEEVKVPSAKVTFMEESEENLSYIVCITPENRYMMIKDGSFIAEISGTYKIRYYALDKYGNYTIKEYTVTCYV